MSTSHRSSGVYLVDVDRLVIDALSAVGLGDRAADMLRRGMQDAGLEALPGNAEPLWHFVKATLLPLIEADAGPLAAERVMATLQGGIGALDRIQCGLGPKFARST